MTTIATEGLGATRRLAGFTEGLAFADIPVEAVTVAKWLTLNFLGCAVWGVSMDAPRIALGVYGEMGGNGDAVVVGSGVRLPVAMAAAVNAQAAYAVMNCDTFYEAPSHPGKAILGAALAAAEKHGKSGVAFLTACVAGFEAACRVDAALSQDVVANKSLLGWHSTLTDPIGAGVAAGKLLDLEEGELAAAIGVAATSASGVRRAVMGSHAYSYDGGRGTLLGVLAAYLARSGMTIADGALERPKGYVAMFTGGNPPERAFTRLTRGLGSEWEIQNMEVKNRCAGAQFQAGIDAAYLVVRDNAVALEQIKSIRVSVSEAMGVRRPHGEVFDYPSSFADLPYSAAVAVVDGRSFTTPEDMVSHLDDPVVRDLAWKIAFESKEPVNGYSEHIWPGRAVLETVDGARHEVYVEHAKGKFPENPLTREEIIAKFKRCGERRFDDARLDQIVEMVENLEQVDDIAELANLLQAP